MTTKTRTAQQRSSRVIRNWLKQGRVTRNISNPWIYYVTDPNGIKVYKKVKSNTTTGVATIELLLEKGTRFVFVSGLYGDGGKCRAEKAKVVKGSGCSFYDSYFIYCEGAVVAPDMPFNTYKLTCTSGIHFFPCKRNADEYR